MNHREMVRVKWGQKRSREASRQPGSDKKQAGRQAKAKAGGLGKVGDRGWGKGQGTSPV